MRNHRCWRGRADHAVKKLETSEVSRGTHRTNVLDGESFRLVDIVHRCSRNIAACSQARFYDNERNWRTCALVSTDNKLHLCNQRLLGGGAALKRPAAQ